MLEFAVAPIPCARRSLVSGHSRKPFLHRALTQGGAERLFCCFSLYSRSCHVSSLLWPLATRWELCFPCDQLTYSSVWDKLSPERWGTVPSSMYGCIWNRHDSLIHKKLAFLSPWIPQFSNVPISTETHLENLIMSRCLAYIWLPAPCSSVILLGDMYVIFFQNLPIQHNFWSLCISFISSVRKHFSAVIWCGHAPNRGFGCTQAFQGRILMTMFWFLFLFFAPWYANHRTIWHCYRSVWADYATASYYSYEVWKWWVKWIKNNVTVQESSEAQTLFCENGNIVVQRAFLKHLMSRWQMKINLIHE